MNRCFPEDLFEEAKISENYQFRHFGGKSYMKYPHKMDFEGNLSNLETALHFLETFSIWISW